MAAAFGGTSIFWAATIGVGAESVASATASVGPNTLSRLYRAWGRACRFRRRWPSVHQQLLPRTATDTPVVLPGNYYSAPSGFRPALAAPPLSPLPQAMSASTIAWWIRPGLGQSVADLATQIRRLPDVDVRVLGARLEHLGSGRLLLVVRFDTIEEPAPVGPGPPPSGAERTSGPDPDSNGPAPTNGSTVDGPVNGDEKEAGSENRRKGTDDGWSYTEKNSTGLDDMEGWLR